jgi:UDP-sugar pyrophosphorylase
MALTGTGKKWQAAGVEHILFFQDTNGIVFNCVPAALGVSISEGFEVNSITVPRRAGEAAGGIVRLEKEDGSALTLNVEYNQLDPLLRSTINPEGDVADQSGYSPYPGNINVLVFALKPYLENLSQNGGLIPEFVNPKYVDSTKESFKKTTRLECMMQDYPKLLGAKAKVGFTSFPRQFCFSAVKNNLSDAALKSENNLPAESASSGEMDIYAVARQKLKLVGVEIEEASSVKIKGINLIPGPRVVLGGSFSSTIHDLESRLKHIKISSTSTLVIEGDVDIDGLVLDGKLVVKAKGSAKLSLKGLNVSNGGDVLVPCSDEAKEEIAIRGYTLEEQGVRIIESDQDLTVTK